MMDNLRAAANHVVLKIILGLIILSFILTGVSNYLIGGNSNYAAKVNDQEISRTQLENAFNNERSNLERRLGDRFSELASNEQYMAELRQRALQGLIDEALINQYARSLHLEISDEQVRQAIFKNPAFQNDGKFDNARYNAIITSMGMNADQYVQALRNQLTTDQLVKAVMGSDFILPGESDQFAALLSQERQVRTATISVDALAQKQQVSEQEIQNYYQQHTNNFMSPEQFRVSYIKLDAATLDENASEEEIQAYYDKHQDEFGQPQRNRYSLIQTKTEADANAVLAQLKQGADFATLAKEKSVDVITARNGGDMGWLEPGTTPEEFKNAGLKEKGQLSGVIKSSVGFLIVRLDDIEPAKVKPLSEVHNDISAKVKQEKALDAFFALQRKVSDAANNDNESLASAEKASGVKAVETGWFSRDAVPQELNFKPVTDALFGGNLLGQDGTPGSNSDIISVEGDRAFVVRITDHKPQAEKPLAEVKDQVSALVKHEKALKQANEEAQKLLSALKAGKGDEALKTAGISFSPPKTFERITQDTLTQPVFALPLPAKDKPSYGIGNDMQGNVACWRSTKCVAVQCLKHRKK
ncbi:Peptidyl-prolyl cis-trans isomerase ppiD [Cronobacter condimenti 1330]|uniref:Periplasmic chaperone PpiD n=1 Tax=Cronobacter condimenti 1330 TaxID=1073999 RepID=K8AB02_9ENTR|nr:Peptidyl-prolyl cis-trans isomerase ppiD [Cronobacter condimenti 1330]